MFARVGNAIYFAATTRADGTELWVTDGSGTRQVRDIHAGPSSSMPSNLAEFSGRLFFIADDGVHGAELWQSDGTRTGTTLVRDIHPGRTRGMSWRDNPLLTVIGGQLYFSADDGVHGLELWTTDGSVAGTRMVSDVYPGPSGSRPENFCVLRGVLYFNGAARLWRSDGTAAGTTQLGTVTNPRFLTAMGGHVYFSAATPATGHEVYRTDGTAAGTELFFEAKPGTAQGLPWAITAGPTRLYFAAWSPAGLQIWGSDGTLAGTQWLCAAGMGTPTTFAYAFTTMNDRLYFINRDATFGVELWSSDGSAAGTGMVKDLSRGSASSEPHCLQPIGSTLFFYADPGSGRAQLCSSDGTAAGTRVVHSVYATNQTRYLVQRTEMRSWFATSIQGDLLFAASDTTHGAELWQTDGTRAGTVLRSDLDSTLPGETADADPSTVVDFYGTTFFVADDGIHGAELWSHRAGGGTRMVKDIESGSGGSNPRDLTVVGSELFFVASTGGQGSELWATDGTSTGTRLVRDIRAGQRPSRPEDLCALDGVLYFSAHDGVTGRELWRSDGSRGGTRMVREILPGSYGSNPEYLTVVNGQLLFRAEGVRFDSELWRSDGSSNGTVRVKDIRTGTAGSLLIDFQRLGDRLLFLAKDRSGSFGHPAGYQLWRSDGTTSGTAKVLDVLPNGDAQVQGLVQAGNHVYFRATLPATGEELWVSDGTTGGSRLLFDIQPGRRPSNPRELRAFGDRLLFQANDGVHGAEPWVTNGRPSGTHMIRDLEPGGDSSRPEDFFAPGQRFAWFRASTAAAGPELFRTDGTAVGTVSVADIRPGPHGSAPSPLGVANGLLYVAADDGYHGRELWTLDPGALAYPHGVGCAGIGDPPTLQAVDPVLGKKLVMIGHDPLGARTAVLFLATPAVGPASFPGPCWIYLDPAVMFFLAGRPIQANKWSHEISIPSQSALIGFQAVIQAAVGPVNQPIGVHLTNGVWLRFGR